MGYTVLVTVRQAFLKWICKHGLLAEYAYEGLEEYAEGSAGGLSLYWPEAARRSCSEGAFVRADWLRERFMNECAVSGRLPPPRLAFLHSDDPSLFTPVNPPRVEIIPPRNPAARIIGLPYSASANSPPPYREDHEVHEKDCPPDSTGFKTHG